METSVARARWTALIAIFVLLGIAGLALQVVASWSSVPGDAVWSACGLSFALAAVVDPQRPKTRAGRVAMTALVLFGLSVAFLMVYWIFVDAGQIGRMNSAYLALPIGLGVIGIVATMRAAAPPRAR